MEDVKTLPQEVQAVPEEGAYRLAFGRDRFQPPQVTVLKGQCSHASIPPAASVTVQSVKDPGKAPRFSDFISPDNSLPLGWTWQKF